ncbi:hypothetical protein [Neptuniibacter sp. QD37_11]|uniref:hypothetical protein n=1 Tax=Neptuniibacter sp. QD37_11 TaxID=3398209 RepID=UPI0039F4C6E3
MLTMIYPDAIWAFECLLVVVASAIGILFVDGFMTYLQGRDNPWIIPVSLPTALLQIALFIGTSSLAYLITSTLFAIKPLTPSEPYIMGGLFAALAASMVRGYFMVATHERRINLKTASSLTEFDPAHYWQFKKVQTYHGYLKR